MALFHRPDHRVLKALQALDISVMTPLDAINSLNELQRMLEADQRDKS
jgi:hypothetical protein